MFSPVMLGVTPPRRVWMHTTASSFVFWSKGVWSSFGGHSSRRRKITFPASQVHAWNRPYLIHLRQVCMCVLNRIAKVTVSDHIDYMNLHSFSYS